MEKRSSRITVGRIVGAVVLAVVIWLVIAGISLYSAQGHARAGLDAMDGLSDVASQDLSTAIDAAGGDVDDIDEENAEAHLRAAAEEFGAARSLLSSLVVRPLWYTPVLGRQLHSAAALSSAAETTADAAADVVAEFNDVLGDSTASGDARVDAVQRARAVLTEFRSEVQDLDLGPGEALIGPLADARERFSEEHARVMDVLEENLVVLDGVGNFLTGPSPYLLLAANNAEMRAGSGMILQAGPLEVIDGTFIVGDLTPTGDMFLEAPATELPADLEALWGQLSPAQEWRNLNLTPRFEQTAETAAAMWGAVGGKPVEGAILLDVVALESLLELTGPVTLSSGEVIDENNVVQDLLVDQYAQFVGDSDARRDRLGEVAEKVLTAVNERSVSALELVRTLRELGAGRHVLMWSSDPLQAAAWEAIGTDGSLAENSMLLSILNRGGNKLDPYLRVISGVGVERSPDAQRVSVQVELTNDAPTGLSQYVAGPFPFSDMSEGEYRAVVALTLPSGAANITSDGGVPVAVGPDGPTQVAALEVGIPRGTTATLTFEFDLHPEWDSLDVLSSARVVPTQWHDEHGSWTDDEPHTISLGSGPGG